MSEFEPRDLVPTEPPPPAPEGWVPPPPYTPAPPRQQPWSRWIAVVTVVATILAAGGGLGIGLTMARYLHTSTHAAQTATLPKTTEPSSATAPITAAPPSSSQNGTINVQAITAAVAPAIVDINTVIQTTTGTGSAAGTGMIITSSGEVLTNNHVVDGSISISVVVSGKGTYTAHVIGVSPTADVALIQIEGVSGLPTVTLADSSSVKAGDAVLALGNALGQGGAPTVTQGQVLAIDQTITANEGNGRSETLNGMIQSDAAISPGDSGGALVNSAGQVIGMITAGEAQGFRTVSSPIGYAVNTNSALAVVNQVRSGQATADVIIGPVGYMGISVRDLDSQIAAQYNLSLSSGALVWTVQAGSPAEQAGITKLSVITKVGSSSIASTDALGKAIHGYKPGATVSVTWIDQGGTSHTKSVTLTTGPNI